MLLKEWVAIKGSYYVFSTTLSFDVVATGKLSSQKGRRYYKHKQISWIGIRIHFKTPGCNHTHALNRQIWLSYLYRES